MSFQKKAFTIVEILVVVSIIAILVTVVLTMVLKAKNKASINSYKTTMQSLRTAMESCTLGNNFPAASTYSVGTAICGGAEKFPVIDSRCGAQPSFEVAGSSTNWAVRTQSGWDCKDCRLICDVKGCEEDPSSPTLGSCK